MDDERIGRLLENIRRDCGGAFASGLAYIGNRLGLFDGVAAHGPCCSAHLARALELNERYVREWLKAMTAFGYIEHDDGGGTYWMSKEQKAVLTDAEAPCFGAGTFQFTLPSLRHTEALIDCFRHGGGIAYEDLGDEIPASIDSMHRPWFEHLLTGAWLPAMPEINALLRRGITVLDVGCGLGRSTVALARVYPGSRIVGVDPHGPSIAAARALASELTNVSFLEATIEQLSEGGGGAPRPYWGDGFDLVVAIDCVHDMHDPVGVVRHIKDLLVPTGAFLWSEPTGSDNPLENRDSLGRLRQALSLYHCLTVSLAGGGAGLGTLIGERGARQIAAKAGFERFEVLPVDSPAQLFYLLRA